MEGTKRYLSLEPALSEATERRLISCDKLKLRDTRIKVEQIVGQLATAMKAQSTTFRKLYVKNFGVGSIYENTKIGDIDEFDIDIVLKLPEVVRPVLKRKKCAGFVQFQLRRFGRLANIDPELHRDMSVFVDSKNYLLSEEFMKVFIWKTFDQAIASSFPDNVIEIGGTKYSITNVEYIEPALTLNIQGPDLHMSIDLVASFLLSNKLWPKTNCRRNPCSLLSEFFLTPARPTGNNIHQNRFWRLSFHAQEKQIIHDRHFLKSAYRVLKQIRNHFNQAVHSYALKTLFFWELVNKNAMPGLWRAPLSYVVIYMLERYLDALTDGNIPYFWNYRLNLLSYLSNEEIERYRKDIHDMLCDIKSSPTSQTLLSYLK